MISAIDGEEREIKAVFIPADVSQPIQDITIFQPKDKALQCFTDYCKLHFADQALTPQQKKTLKTQYMKDERVKGVDSNVMSALLNHTMCDIVVLQPNRKEFGFVSINVYVDDKGIAKSLPINVRATSIAAECGLHIQILGDCFLGKQFDDDNGFCRLDFSTLDLNTTLPWFKEAKKFYLNKIRNSSEISNKLKALTCKNPMIEKAESLKAEANTLYKENKYSEACDKYFSAFQILDVDKNKATDQEISKLVAALFSNISLCYDKMNNFPAAVEAAQKCIEHRPAWFKGYARLAKASLGMSLFKEALLAAEKALTYNKNNKEVQELLTQAKTNVI